MTQPLSNDPIINKLKESKQGVIFFYNLIKSTAIYLVILYHYGTLDIDTIASTSYSVYFNYFFSGISSIAVPLFFMVNGALLLNKDYDLKKHLYKIATISILFLVWGTITLATEAPKLGDHYSLSQFVKSVYFTKLGRTNHLWFLLAIIYIYLLFPMIKAVFDKNDFKLNTYVLGLIFIFTFGIVFLTELLNISGYLLRSNTLRVVEIQTFVWFNPFNIYFSYSLVYFIIGGWLAKDITALTVKKSTCTILFLLSWLSLFLFGLVKTSLNHNVYNTVYSGYDTVMTLVMSISFFIFSSKIKIKNPKIEKAISAVGSNTFGIYFIHVPLGFWLTDFYRKLSVSNYFFFDLCYAFLLMYLALVVTLGLKKLPLLQRLVKM